MCPRSHCRHSRLPRRVRPRKERSESYAGVRQASARVRSKQRADRSEHRAATPKAPGAAFYFTPDKAILTFTEKEKGVALHLTPLDASPRTKLVRKQRAPGKVDYLVGSEHHRNLPTYRELAYRNVWPGVDLVFRGQGGTLKYELHAQAGADLSKINLAYGGADGVSVGKGGNLLIQTPLGTLRDAHPRSYQRIGGKRVPVDSRYDVKSHGNCLRLRARAAPTIPRRPLVIDPGIEYSTYLGGSGSDRADEVAVDAAGNAYVTGRANSGFPTTAGAFDTSCERRRRCLCQQAERHRLGPRVLDLPRRRDSRRRASRSRSTAAGSAYITGSTGSTDFPTTAGAYDTTYNAAAGSANAFVTKLSPDGAALAYSTYVGGFKRAGLRPWQRDVVDSTGAGIGRGGGALDQLRRHTRAHLTRRRAAASTRQ